MDVILGDRGMAEFENPFSFFLFLMFLAGAPVCLLRI
jgi:hypothetical protein